MSSKLEIQWTPQPNKFLTWGAEVCLYEVQPIKDGFVHSVKLSNTKGAQLLATNTNYNYIKCLDVYPRPESDILVAVGQANGRITLSTLGISESDVQGLSGKDLVPRQSRPCNAVAWNPIDTNLIAAGLDKHRGDNAVLIWDIMKYPLNINECNNSGRLAVNTMAPAVELAKPVIELGVGETVNSLGWFYGNGKVLASGMNLKCIKLVDFRDPNKVVNTTLTKAVHGICVNPHDDRHLASYIDNQLLIWDTRSFDKPVLTLPHLKSLLKISWSPTKYNLLGCLLKDSSVMSVYDIQQTHVGNEEVEPAVLERIVNPGSPHNITSFSWHHSDENRFLSIALSGTITDYTIFDRITLNWASTSNIVWTYGRKTMKCIKDEPLVDIAGKIKQRAIKEYGLKVEFWKNGELVDNEMLTNVWNWLSLTSRLVEEGTIRGSNNRHPGVQSVIKVDSITNKSETINVSWSDLGNNNCHGYARMFKHEDRDKGLHLCSWPVDRESPYLSRYLEQLETDGAYTRAATIAVFNLKIRQAIEILFRVPESNENRCNLNIVAMALAGFSDDKSSIWRQFCSSTKVKLSDPYLKALFGFLTAENYNYDAVFNENGVAVDDRVAFACIFLPDSKLQDYLKKLSDKLIDEGNLDGLLLTGATQDAVKLLQRYLDNTGDIQSTALIAVRAFPSELLSLENVKDWISSYRNLLDTWQLWNERAHFDIMLSSDKTPQQVYVSCSFCGKSISAYMQGLNRGRGPFPRMGGTANKIKMSSCPNCRKPLPRCAICLMHMGTTTGLNGENETNKLIEFANWFTWCQSCRHGGHASHLMHWFEEHTECPVTACNCRCFSVDSVTNISTA